MAGDAIWVEKRTPLLSEADEPNVAGPAILLMLHRSSILNKEERWVRGEEQLKEELCSATVVKLPDHYKP